MEWIYDRTQADVDRVSLLNQKYATGAISEEEKKEWDAGMKGALNAADLNRIEGNIREIAGVLAVSVVTKTWEKEQIPRVSDFFANSRQRAENPRRMEHLKRYS